MPGSCVRSGKQASRGPRFHVAGLPVRSQGLPRGTDCCSGSLQGGRGAVRPVQSAVHKPGCRGDRHRPVLLQSGSACARLLPGTNPSPLSCRNFYFFFFLFLPVTFTSTFLKSFRVCSLPDPFPPSVPSLRPVLTRTVCKCTAGKSFVLHL